MSRNSKKVVYSCALLLTIYSTQTRADVSSGNLNDITPVCIGSALTYDAETTGSDARDTNPGHAYGELTTAPNPAWFYFKVDVGGTLVLSQSNTRNKDVDGALWGPFDSVDSLVRDGNTASYEPGILIDSDYANAADFEFTTNVDAGKFYALLVTNFSGEATEVSLDSGSGTAATTDCGITYGVDVTSDDAVITVTEGGASDNFSVSLYREPSSNVTINVTSSNSEVSPSSTSISFTTANWSTPQIITLSAIDDALLDGDISDTVTLTASSGDPNYDGKIAEIVSLAVDNEILTAPSINSLTTSDNTPTLTGSHNSTANLAVTVGSVTYTEPDVNLIDNGDGTWVLNIPISLSDNTYDVVATSVFGSDIESDSTSNELVVDTSDPVPSVTILNITSDNILNIAEASSTVTINGVVSGEFTDGDIVKLTVDGDELSTPINSAGAFSIDVAGTLLLSSSTIDANISTTDMAGNTGSDNYTHTYTIDSVAPTPTFSLVSITPDNIINAVESAGNVAITGEIDGEFNAGDRVTLVVNGNLFIGTVSAGGDFSVNIPGTNLLVDDRVNATIYTTDIAGNPGSTSTTTNYSVDTDSPTLSISVNDISNDNTINATESGESVTVTGTVTGEYIPGDLVTITVNGNTHTGAIDTLGNFSVEVPGSELAASNTISASISSDDAAGNSGSANDSANYTVDITPPTLTISIDDISTDNVINKDESNNQVSVTGTVTGDFVSGDTVSVSVNGTSYSGTVNGSGAYAIDVPGSTLAADSSVTVSITSTDDANNTSTETQNHLYFVDTILPVVDAIDIELTDSSTPELTGTSNEITGSIINISNSEGDPLCSATLDIEGNWSCVSAFPLSQDTHVLVVELFDAAGNRATTNANVTVDFDFDGDGIPNHIEGSDDFDADGIPNYLDTDSDDDGIIDTIEASNLPGIAGLDSDADGIDDAFDVTQTGGSDINGNGIDDLFEPVDTDGDLLPDFLDFDSDNDGIADALDSDNDGISDNEEGSVDSDGDGTEDYLDIDSDGDTIPDAVEGPGDFDKDGAADFVDIDSDNDGLVDSLESGPNPESPVDTDGDGLPDFRDVDSDDDNVTDNLEDITDSDGDGIDDANDPDSNNDGIIDASLSTSDFDGDGIPDYLDGDIDGDRIANITENQYGDTDSDGQPDYLDTDSDGDGIPDANERQIDTDGDGLQNYRDTDADGDGINDAIEAGPDPLVPVDTDGNGKPDYLDHDADGDSIPDAVETTMDSDFDGIPDYLDLDSDNDGLTDEEEGTSDSDGDGVPNFIDSDDNGSNVATDSLIDSDGDGLPDAIDDDSDNDGISDIIEGDQDTDNDGIPDALDLDSDNDGVPDIRESMRDSDGDGVPNFRDLDSDNDGISDIREAGGSDADGNGLIDSYVDANADGIDDSTATTPFDLADFDNDGIEDYRDSDSDNDGLTDLAESFGYDQDVNGDGIIDNFTDDNGDGLDDGYAVLSLLPEDTDADGMPDHLDLDTDNDGVLDLIEAGGLDIDGDGVVDALADSDADGIPDSVDVDQTMGADADADGIDDRADTDFVSGNDQDLDGIIDALDPDADGDGFVNILLDGGDASFQIAPALPDFDSNGIPDVEQANIAGNVNVGLTGVGCSISTRGKSNESFLMLLAMSAWIMLMRRRLPGKRADRIKR